MKHKFSRLGIEPK